MKLRHAFVLILLMAVPRPIFAHGLIGNELSAGSSNPIAGWDHLVAIIAVGIVSTKMDGRSIWGVLLLFLPSIAVGYSIGIQHVIWPYAEWGVPLSLVGLGLLMTLPRRPQLLVVSLTILLFGMSHGYAHGIEWIDKTSGWWHSLGFLGITIGVYIMGVILGLLCREVNDPTRSFALAGTGMMTAGVVLMLFSLVQNGGILL
ncbi:HupE/UreJ family protein [Chloroflexi bacterium TSY]|nr:HupE/UreJ family protein [Chloroflexi bacterium TSY]